MLSINNLSFAFGDVEVLKDINLHLNKGEFVSVIGPSGCGKSTLFKLLTKIHKSYEGEIKVENVNLLDGDYNVGYMPQNDLLLPWKSVAENALLPLRLKNKPLNQVDLDNDLKIFGLEGFKNSYPHELSGGMKQRVSLLRTINIGSDLLLLDEPFGALDSITRFKLQNWLSKLIKKYHKTVLFITHDIDEAIYLSDRIYILSNRPASIVREINISFGKDRTKSILADSRFVTIKQEILSILTE